MEATITTIGDIFKKKVEDSFEYPTVWIDLDGNIQTDDKCELIEAVPITRLSHYETYPAIEEWLTTDNRRAEKLVFAGTIIQVGSHVTECGPLLTSKTFTVDEIDFSKIFAKAKNLRIAQSCFYGCSSLTKIPEDLFANCPHLVACYSTFCSTPIYSIPENLFAHNPRLNSIKHCFAYCFDLTVVPEGLFAHNPHLKNTRDAFDETKVTEIPPTVEQLKQQ